MSVRQHLRSRIDNTRNIESRRNEMQIRNNNNFANVYNFPIEDRTEDAAINSQARA